MKDITKEIEEERVPLCPLCDNPIMAYSGAELAICKTEMDVGIVCAIHTECAKDLPNS